MLVLSLPDVVFHRLRLWILNQQILTERDQMEKSDVFDLIIDTIATHDAEQIRRLVDNGEPLSTTAAGLGYTPSEALQLLDHAANHPDILVGWWKEYN